jgi:hypothetical protein
MYAHPKHALPVGCEIGGYRIVRVVGQGGFGIVYEARNPTTGERVAVKEFYPTAIATRHDGTILVNSEGERELFARVLERFQEEARLQFALDHPNILKVKNYVAGANTGYMISDFIEGQSLRGHLQDQGGCFLSAELFRAVMEQVIAAVGHVHEQGKLHRDISPDNIMVDRSGRAVLLDFGAAKLDLRASATFSTVVLFKEDYAPPEQVERSPEHPEGFHTDIFALAGTMYCALAGSPPRRATARLLSPSGDPYVSIGRASQVRCAPPVLAAIDRGLRLAAQERPQSIADFVALLGWSPRPRAVTVQAVPPPLPAPEASKPPMAPRGVDRPETGVPAPASPPVAEVAPAKPAPEEAAAMPTPSRRWHRPATAAALLAAAIVALVVASPGRQPPLAPASVPADLQPQTEPGTGRTQPRVIALNRVTAPPAVEPSAQPESRSPDTLPEAAPVGAVREPAATDPQPPAPAPPVAAQPAPAPVPVEPAPLAAGEEQTLGLRPGDPGDREDTARLEPPVAPAPPPGFVSRENRDMDGGDLGAPLKNVDMAACQVACRSNRACVAVSFDKWNRWCFLKRAVVALRLEPQSDTAIRADHPVPAQVTAAVTMESFRALFPGSGYRTSEAKSRESCSDLCLKDARCLAYTFRANACTLFDQPAEYSRNSTALSGVKRQLPAAR